ncbi:MAG: hypothetical protein J6Q61_06585 [Bacteroidales bacterium]|nr:hypothetical protein [Bacteroidales bacterium]
MAAEYSAVALQTVGVDDNIIFNNGSRACKKGFISHRDDSGIFTLQGARNGCKAIYKVSFQANIAIATDGTVEPISVALTINGETLGNATAIVTPVAIGDFWSVSVETFIDIPCTCCVTVSVENTSDTTAIDVQNANIIFDRVA